MRGLRLEIKVDRPISYVDAHGVKILRQSREGENYYSIIITIPESVEAAVDVQIPEWEEERAQGSSGDSS